MSKGENSPANDLLILSAQWTKTQHVHKVHKRKYFHLKYSALKKHAQNGFEVFSFMLR